jgi:tetratricopeptide (TPR) repeat protein
LDCGSPLPLFLLLALPLPSFAHDSPEHKIDDLSFQIARSGKNPALLMERAFEHRALGQLAAAAADFEAAHQLDPKLTHALKELALVQLAQGKADTALATLNRAVAENASSDTLIARAEILTAQHDYRAALRDCEAVFRQSTDNPEWYLLRAQLQRRLGLFPECLRDLRAGFARTGSAVLKEECIDAMIDAGQHKTALKQIEPELRDSRWRSSWLIRRARVRLALSETKAAQRDLRAALKELNSRFVPNAPELTLIIDIGLAHALLGDLSAAASDLRVARTLSREDPMLWRLEKSLANSLSH